MRTRTRFVGWIGLLAALGGLVGVAVSKEVKSGAQVPVEPQVMYPGGETIDIERIKGDLGYLTSDTLEGRGSGAKGGQTAGNWIAQQLAWLGLQPGGSNGYFQPFSVGGRNMRNIIAQIPGSGSNEIVVIGAHYDHVGMGYQPGAFGPRGQVHNGADDNGSGSTALLQIVRAFVKANKQYRRKLVFMFFDGEERGLLGSKHWVANRTIQGKITLMINMDMIGRLRGSLEITHNGGSQLSNWVAAANRTVGLTIKNGRNIQPDSDHYPFYQQRIPVLIPFTGFHDNYHRPSDDLDKINLPGIRDTARLCFNVAIQALDAGVNLTAKGAIHKIDLNSVKEGCHHYHPKAVIPKTKTR